PPVVEDAEPWLEGKPGKSPEMILAAEWLERSSRSREDDARPWNPVRTLAMDEVADHLHRTPGSRPLAAVDQIGGQPVQHLTEHARRTREHVERVVDERFGLHGNARARGLPLDANGGSGAPAVG